VETIASGIKNGRKQNNEKSEIQKKKGMQRVSRAK
jgi:hypothetical protein